MTALITTDLHLTDHPRDADRFNLFPWIREQVEKHKVRNVILLGDLTDAKDRHSSRLVNRFADAIGKIAETCCVDIIPGNHDAIDMSYPFFEFLKEIPRVSFNLKPSHIDSEFLLLPHTKNHKEEWADWKHWIFPNTKYILCHQTFDGAKAENGQELRGIAPSFFKSFKGHVYSGDVHVPQIVSRNPHIEYVGAPYRIHFGDTYEPRVLLLRDGQAKSLSFPARGREVFVIRNLRDLQRRDCVSGTQVKIRVQIKRSEYPDYPKLKKEIIKHVNERQWELCGLELMQLKTRDVDTETEIDVSTVVPEDRLHDFARRKKLSKELRSLGIDLLKEVQ